MAATGKREKKFGGFARINWLSQNSPAQRDSCIGTQNDVALFSLHRLCFLSGNPAAIGQRQFALQRGFVYVGCANGIGLHAKLRQQVQPTRAARSEDKRHLGGVT